MAFDVVRAESDASERVVAHRRAMFLDMGHADDESMQRMIAEFRPWVAAKMQAGEYLAWFATVDGVVVGGAGLWLMEWPPHLVCRGTVRGNIVNVYTQPEYRRQGIARALVAAALDWCRNNGVPCVILHASKEGRAIYERMGFAATNEMRISL